MTLEGPVMTSNETIQWGHWCGQCERLMPCGECASWCVLPDPCQVCGSTRYQYPAERY